MGDLEGRDERREVGRSEDDSNAGTYVLFGEPYAGDGGIRFEPVRGV